MLRTGRLNRYFNTVWAIAESRYVEQFLIGFTSRSAHARFTEYKSLEYDYLVILADRLTRSEAHNLEKYLQDRIKDDKGHMLYKKYNRRRRDLRYYPSYGASGVDPGSPVHSVYMAWWE